MTDLVAAVSGYARRLHRAIGDKHHVASPLGAWLVLALAAPAATGDRRAALEQVLGADADSAAAGAGELLRSPHSALRLGAAAWRRPETVTPALTDWLDRIAGSVLVGDLPGQQGADAWADEMTGGLVKRFPIRIDDDTVLVLASALACAISWRRPFDTISSAELELPLAPGFDGLRTLLRDPGSADRQAIVSSDVGPLGVHAARSGADDLVVVSVIADPGVAAADVIAAAHPIAAAIATRTGPLPALSLFDLPLGAGPAWTIGERVAQVAGREERYESVLPAWSAQSTHDLLARPELGFGAAAAALGGLLTPDPRGYRVEAKQVALARYSRTGFEAAAVTAIGMRTSARAAAEGVVRTARIEFGHPYAVVAVARGDRTPWAGLPVFSAWIASPDEAD